MSQMELLGVIFVRIKSPGCIILRQVLEGMKLVENGQSLGQ